MRLEAGKSAGSSCHDRGLGARSSVEAGANRDQGASESVTDLHQEVAASIGMEGYGLIQEPIPIGVLRPNPALNVDGHSVDHRAHSLVLSSPVISRVDHYSGSGPRMSMP
jgi:hypothetical protein